MIAQLDKHYVAVARTRTFVRLASYGMFEGRPVTTRGQWINPAVEAHLRFALRFARPAVPERPIFILGVGRSGTTLLGKLLGVHPAVGYLNEPKMMWHLIDPVEDVTGFYYTAGQGQFVRTAADVTPEMRTRAQRLYGYYLRATRTTRFVDKIGELGYRREYLRALFPDCVLVAIVRRPQAMARSVAKWSLDHGSPGADWWGVNDRKWILLRDTVLANEPDSEQLLSVAASNPTEVDRALLEWVAEMRAITDHDSRAPVDAVIRYEDLVSHPVDQMRKVLDAVGLPQSRRVDQLAAASVTPDARRDASTREINPKLQSAIAELLPRLGYNEIG